jgi:energy-coupling factor transport system ATP-binding protein
MTQAGQPILVLADVSFRYGRGAPSAIDGVSLQIGAGQVVGIAGRNGSGKTTLARLCNGLLRPTDGTVVVDGLDTSRTGVRALASHVASAFQNPSHQLFASSVAAELAFGPRNLGLAEPEVARRVADAAGRFGLGDVLETHPYRLGRGPRKLLSIASVVTMGTPVLVLDEPTTGLDQPTRTAVSRIVGELRDRGTTIVCVSHDMRLIADVADRLVVLGAGRIIADGPPLAVFADEPAMLAAGLEPPQATALALRLRSASASWPPLSIEGVAAAIRDGSATRS